MRCSHLCDAAIDIAHIHVACIQLITGIDKQAAIAEDARVAATSGVISVTLFFVLHTLSSQRLDLDDCAATATAVSTTAATGGTDSRCCHAPSTDKAEHDRRQHLQKTCGTS